MFGYVQIEKSELPVKEYETYKSIYCALCKTLGKEYSVFARFILSYDFTFFAALSMGVRDQKVCFNKGRCTFNPLKKCVFCGTGNDDMKKAAALSVITAFYKLKDDIRDGRTGKKIRSYLVYPFFSRWRKKAAQKYPEYEEAVSAMSQMQEQVEEDQMCHIDIAAEPTAKMLASVMEMQAKDEMEKRIFSELGYHLGRWIYFIDAVDDLEKDKKDGNFNPFLKYIKDEGDNENLKKYCNEVLNQSMCLSYNAYNLADIKRFKGILDNIYLKGLPFVQRKVLFGKGEFNDEESL